MSIAVQCKGVWKTFGIGSGAVTALKDIDLIVEDGEFVTLVGASGCGKSTLLRTIAGIETHNAGKISVGGVPISGPGVDRAMVFQNYSLYAGWPPILAIAPAPMSRSRRVVRMHCWG
jgi:NitT/TauT family transport system ATP-binding protein